jgi:hypothetical protein
MELDKKNIRTAIIVAIIAGFFTVINNIYSSFKTLELERKQYESNLILKLIVPNDTVQSINNIKFFVESGFLSDKNEKIYSLFSKYKIDLTSNFNNSTIEPNNPPFVNENEIYLGQVLDFKDSPIENVNVKIFKNRKIKNDTTSFSNTKTDKNGLFKLYLPKDDDILKIEYSTKGYNSLTSITSKKFLKNKKIIYLEKE